MPFYDFRCAECGNTEAIFRKIDQRDIPHYCCSKEATRVISKAIIRGDLEPYVSPVTGKLINSRAQRDEELKRENCRINEPGMKEEIARNSWELKEKTAEAAVAHIDQTVSELHAAGHI